MVLIIKESFRERLKNMLEGGPGSGVKGHTTYNPDGTEKPNELKGEPIDYKSFDIDTKGFNKKQLNKVKNILYKFPPKLIELGLKKIEIIPWTDDPKFELAEYHPKTKTITIMDGVMENIATVMEHEIGHSIDVPHSKYSLSDEWLNITGFNPVIKKNGDVVWNKTKNEDSYPYYSEEIVDGKNTSKVPNSIEDFAASIALYLSEQERFKSNFPKRYKYIDKLFNNKESIKEKLTRLKENL